MGGDSWADCGKGLEAIFGLRPYRYICRMHCVRDWPGLFAGLASTMFRKVARVVVNYDKQRMESWCQEKEGLLFLRLLLVSSSSVTRAVKLHLVCRLLWYSTTRRRCRVTLL